MIDTILFVLLTAPANSSGESQNPLISLLPLILIILVFYLFMIRPQIKKQKELRNYRNSLDKGDKVITTGGIHGKVASVSDNFITLDAGNNIILKIDKNAILKDPNDLSNRK
ncbi:MAG: preprotein translocase subunit YajC [Bacteroidota bacterium]